MFKCHRQFVEGWMEGVKLVCFKEDNHCLGEKKLILIQMYLLPYEFLFCVSFTFSTDLVIFSFDNHSWVNFISQGE